MTLPLCTQRGSGKWIPGCLNPVPPFGDQVGSKSGGGEGSSVRPRWGRSWGPQRQGGGSFPMPHIISWAHLQVGDGAGLPWFLGHSRCPGKPFPPDIALPRFLLSIPSLPFFSILSVKEPRNEEALLPRTPAPRRGKKAPRRTQAPWKCYLSNGSPGGTLARKCPKLVIVELEMERHPMGKKPSLRVTRWHTGNQKCSI